MPDLALRAPGAGAGARSCEECGSSIAPSLLACPVCHRLVHGARARILAEEADAAAKNGDASTALATWRQVLDLLPPGAQQRAVVAARIDALSREVDAGPKRTEGAPATADPKRAGRSGKAWGPLAALGALLLKFKTLLFLVLGKAKLLLLGLTKASTAFTMLLSFGVYLTAFGWQFALGLVLSIYVHEMGHVAALRRFGIAATAPMFIPGLGALVRLKQHPQNAIEDSRIGLAGPMWGLGAALGAWALGMATGSAMLTAIARVGAWINLFNLLPVWQLDGGRGFRSLSRAEKLVAAGAIAVAWAATRDGLLVLLFLCAVGQLLTSGRAAADGTPEPSDRTGLLQYVVLVFALAALAAIHVPVA